MTRLDRVLAAHRVVMRLRRDSDAVRRWMVQIGIPTRPTARDEVWRAARALLWRPR